MSRPGSTKGWRSGRRTTPAREYRSSLQRALQANELLLIRGMDNFPGRSDQNILAYGQSWHVVNWMMETYGPEKMGRLMGAIKAGDGARRGIQDIYGLDIDQLDAKWRMAIGAPPRSYESVVPTPIALPTIPSIDTAPPQQQPSRRGFGRPRPDGDGHRGRTGLPHYRGGRCCGTASGGGRRRRDRRGPPGRLTAGAPAQRSAGRGGAPAAEGR